MRREFAGGGRGTSARVICTEFAGGCGKFATQTRKVRGVLGECAGRAREEGAERPQGSFARSSRKVRNADSGSLRKMRRISAFYVLGALNSARQYVNIQHFGELYVLKGLF